MPQCECFASQWWTGQLGGRRRVEGQSIRNEMTQVIPIPDSGIKHSRRGLTGGWRESTGFVLTTQK